MIEVKNLTKHYSLLESPAVKDVSFCAKEGKITILLGPNGAGKSTLMNVLSGIYPHGSYEGDIIYDGEVCKFSKIKKSCRGYHFKRNSSGIERYSDTYWRIHDQTVLLV